MNTKLFDYSYDIDYAFNRKVTVNRHIANILKYRPQVASLVIFNAHEPAAQMLAEGTPEYTRFFISLGKPNVTNHY